MRLNPASFAVGLLMLTPADFPVQAAETAVFPLKMKMDSAHINKDVAEKLGQFVFPKHSGTVKLMADWASRLEGLEAKAELTMGTDLLVFTPNGFLDALTMKGLKTVSVPTRDVLEIYEMTSGNGFKGLVLTTRQGTLVFHLDGESFTANFYYSDFMKARAELTSTLRRLCPRAAFYQR